MRRETGVNVGKKRGESPLLLTHPPELFCLACPSERVGQPPKFVVVSGRTSSPLLSILLAQLGSRYLTATQVIRDYLRWQSSVCLSLKMKVVKAG